ncbi:beta-lactamase family protein [Streptomyces sp. NBC_01498]|uniref:serine hydrolase domain-containing protein n=1 Tax=Streptomyces sp. NBC_01498 TaxID=2975870 RepID=UPI002E7AC769|nr:serine hydrolase domain-containing protein [Streptomyces sp. NBC_01498]WTL26543.1 beta-lactamase family protein [Streptomyces sp. NBC_01498]
MTGPEQEPAAGGTRGVAQVARAALAGTPHDRLDAAVRAVDAPDVVFAMSVQGHRTLRASPGAEGLRYEIGSASKPYAGLLLAHLAGTGRLAYDDSAAACLGPEPPPSVAPITLRHLITHTSGLPPLPWDFYPQALSRWSTNPFAGYPAHRVVDAFLRARPHHRPGTRWRYSNFGVSVLGHALSAATRTGWDALLEEQVLAPLGLSATSTSPAGPATDAVGHAADGEREVPPLLMGGFVTAGGVRATPHDLLTFLEAHLRPERTPALADALRAVRRPVLRRGLGKAHTHTLTWFQHQTAEGPAYVHCGATSGQQAFLGFCPGTGTAVAAVATRRFRRADAFVPTAHGVLFGA